MPEILSMRPFSLSIFQPFNLGSKLSFTAMRYTELPPPPALAHLVHCFWFLSGHLGAGEEQQVVADGRLEIILHLAEPFEARDTTGRWGPQSTSLIAGQLTAPIRIRPAGESDVVGIRFRTDGLRALLAVSVAELNDRVVPLHELAPALTGALLHALRQATTPPDRAAALAAVLVRHAQGALDPAVRSMVDHLDVPRAPSIGTVADHHGLNARTVERRVLAATGLSPVELRAVLRFRRVYRRLEAAPTGQWGRLAIASGDYDQAHCIREFRRFTGATPTEWFRRETALADAFLTGKIERLKD
jgi:AraC-like DNA-binding protein